MLDYQKIQQQIAAHFSPPPDSQSHGYWFDHIKNRHLAVWFDAALNFTNIADDYLQEEIITNFISLYPCSKGVEAILGRVFCTLALKYYSSLTSPDRRLKEIMLTGFKRQLKWEEAQVDKESEALTHHYTRILQEYLEFLNGEAEVPPYLGWDIKPIDATACYRRLFFESTSLRREFYCDLLLPKAGTADIMLYHITGYSSQHEQVKRRYSIPENFTKNYQTIQAKYPDRNIALCVIPCPYEDTYKHFILQFTYFLKNQLFASVEGCCGYTGTHQQRGLSAFSRGSFYAYSLVWQEQLVKAVATHSGALLELFTAKLEEGQLPDGDISYMVTCGKKDRLLKNNAQFFEVMKKHGLHAGSHFYPGTHNWQDVEPVFMSGLSWLVEAETPQTLT